LNNGENTCRGIREKERRRLAAEAVRRDEIVAELGCQNEEFEYGTQFLENIKKEIREDLEIDEG